MIINSILVIKRIKGIIWRNKDKKIFCIVWKVWWSSLLLWEILMYKEREKAAVAKDIKKIIKIVFLLK